MRSRQCRCSAEDITVTVVWGAQNSKMVRGTQGAVPFQTGAVLAVWRSTRHTITVCIKFCTAIVTGKWQSVLWRRIVWYGTTNSYGELCDHQLLWSCPACLLSDPNSIWNVTANFGILDFEPERPSKRLRLCITRKFWSTATILQTALCGPVLPQPSSQVTLVWNITWLQVVLRRYSDFAADRS